MMLNEIFPVASPLSSKRTWRHYTHIRLWLASMLGKASVRLALWLQRHATLVTAIRLWKI